MASRFSDMGRRVQERNRDLVERFLCECFVTVRGVLCQTHNKRAVIGDRLVIEVEDNHKYGQSLLLLLPPFDSVVGRVAKEEAEVLLPAFLDPIVMLGDW